MLSNILKTHVQRNAQPLSIFTFSRDLNDLAATAKEIQRHQDQINGEINCSITLHVSSYAFAGFEGLIIIRGEKDGSTLEVRHPLSFGSNKAPITVDLSQFDKYKY